MAKKTVAQLEKELADLKSLVTEGLDQINPSTLCSSGRETYKKLCQESGHSSTDFDPVEFHGISIYDVDNLRFDDIVIEEMSDDTSVFSFDDGIEWLNNQKHNWRVAILDEDNQILAEGTNGNFYVPN